MKKLFGCKVCLTNTRFAPSVLNAVIGYAHIRQDFI